MGELETRPVERILCPPVCSWRRDGTSGRMGGYSIRDRDQ